MNKYLFLFFKKFLEILLEIFIDYVVYSIGVLVILVMLDFLIFFLCVLYSEITDGFYFDILLEMVVVNGRIVFKLF